MGYMLQNCERGHNHWLQVQPLRLKPSAHTGLRCHSLLIALTFKCSQLCQFGAKNYQFLPEL